MIHTAVKVENSIVKRFCVFSFALAKFYVYVSLFIFYFGPFGFIAIFSIGIGINIYEIRKNESKKIVTQGLAF